MDYSLSFDDVLIKPKFSSIVSRKDVNVETTVCSQKFFPVISSNMDTVTGLLMTEAMSNFGAKGCLHRFWSIDENILAFQNSNKRAWISFGLGEKELERANALKDAGATTFILDVAHGANIEVVKQVIAFRESLRYSVSLVVGNFATKDDINIFNEKLGGIGYVDGYKVGIGGGSACTTRLVTGCGVPTLSSLLDCSKANVPIIADGGMRTSGDIAKALAVPNVKAVMLGGMLAGTDETPGPTFEMNKEYRGSASKESYLRQNKTSNWRTPEGETFLVPCKGPVKDVLQNIEAGLKSAFSYVGANNLKEFQQNAEFIQISGNGLKENGAHGKT